MSEEAQSAMDAAVQCAVCNVLSSVQSKVIVCRHPRPRIGGEGEIRGDLRKRGQTVQVRNEAKISMSVPRSGLTASLCEQFVSSENRKRMNSPSTPQMGGSVRAIPINSAVKSLSIRFIRCPRSRSALRSANGTQLSLSLPWFGLSLLSSALL